MGASAMHIPRGMSGCAGAMRMDGVPAAAAPSGTKPSGALPSGTMASQGMKSGAILSCALLSWATILWAAPSWAEPARAEPPHFGRVTSQAEIAPWAITIPPSGAGLPAGSGTARQGAAVYAEKCQACHGAGGSGKPIDALVGGAGTLTSTKPLVTVGSYWPYATTLFDYVRRAMPFNAPESLSADEVYAVSAYILFLNGIVKEDAPLDAQMLPQVKMPNRDGFVDYSAKWR